jgi:hypothetical protein
MRRENIMEQPFDINDALPKFCDKCGCDTYNKRYKLMVVSALAPSNKIKQNIPLEIPIYFCNKCGTEMSQ